MKKRLLITIICGMMAVGTAFSQHTTSMSFVPSGMIFQQNDAFTVEMFLSYSGYSSYGFSVWLETLAGTQSFFHITSEEHFPPFPNGYTGPNEFVFPMTNGVDQGYYATSNDMGGATNLLCLYRRARMTSSAFTFRLRTRLSAPTHSTQRALIRGPRL